VAGTRTQNQLLKRQLLYQLSYQPFKIPRYYTDFAKFFKSQKQPQLGQFFIFS
jgi:hypothetical protein